jgi:hypothetical protein
MSATWPPDRPSRAPGRLALVVLVLVLGLGSAACGDTDGRTTTRELVVPAGTMERLSRGEDVTVMPSVMRFGVGDTLRIRNDDAVAQDVGPYRVEAGAEFEVTFGSAGRFEGFCPLSEGDRYEIVITE